MKLSELFFQLSVGEFSNLSIGKEGAGEIKENRRAAMVVHTNAALLAIYSRFELLSKDVLVEMTGNRTLYPLEARFAEMNELSTEPHKFIKDGLHDKFTDDVIQITHVYDLGGFKYALNDIEIPTSMFTPQPHVLQVAWPRAGVALGVGYRARHPVITWEGNGVESLKQEIILPFFLEDALKKHIAYQVFGNMNGQEHLAKSQECYGAYEIMCVNIEDKDLASQTISTTNTVFEKRGFI